MQALWIAAVLLAANPAGQGTVKPTEAEKPRPVVQQSVPTPVAPNVVEREPLYESDAETDAALRAVYDLKLQIRAALMREANSPADSDEHLAATLELVSLFAAVQANSHFSPDEALRLKTQVRSRLMKIAADLRNDLKREASAAAKAAKLQQLASAKSKPGAQSPGTETAELVPLPGSAVSTASAEQDQAKSSLSLPKETLLFQIGAALGNQPNGATVAGEALIEVIKGATGPQKWDDVGGPGSIFLWKGSSLMQPLRQIGAHALAGAVGGRAVDDHGPELVELIETVISPNTWEKNGGFGSIFYYAPLHVIVVRSTGDVHGNVGNVIGNLRAAGN